MNRPRALSQSPNKWDARMNSFASPSDRPASSKSNSFSSRAASSCSSSESSGDRCFTLRRRSSGIDSRSSEALKCQTRKVVKVRLNTNVQAKVRTNVKHSIVLGQCNPLRLSEALELLAYPLWLAVGRRWPWLDSVGLGSCSAARVS